MGAPPPASRVETVGVTHHLARPLPQCELQKRIDERDFDGTQVKRTSASLG